MTDISAQCLLDCTEAQQEAISHFHGPLLVLAGAGSGKTRVITRRLAWLIGQGVRPHHILAITFTNKAADEMKERVRELGVPDGTWVATFHSTCVRLLRMYGDQLGYGPDFTIYDTADSLSVVKSAMKDLEIDPREWRPSQIAGGISLAKNHMKSAAEVQEQGLIGEQVAKVYTRYEELLKNQNAMDFDDLLLNALKLLRERDEVRERLQDRFRFVMVDEYQDTNRAQYLIAKTLAEAHKNICATGDPDQSIYAWRGADINNILAFEEDYPDARVVRLEQNYRSTKKILRAASNVIKQNVSRKEKDLWTENPEGEPVRVLQCDDEADEAETVAGDIARLVQKGDAVYGDIAVFYRTNAQSRQMETAMTRLGVPHIIVQGVAFYQRKEIKDLLAHLRLLVNPDDFVCLSRVVAAPPTGVGATSLARIRESSERFGASPVEVLRSPKEAGLRGRAAGQAETLYRRLRKLAPLAGQGPHKALSEIVKEVQYLDYLRELDKADDRIANVNELLNSAAQYERENPDGGVTGFLEMAALVSDQDRFDSEAGAVSLMTLHCAKGLEFDHVYLVGCEEGLLPLARNDEVENMEEERRLCFVGMTRARKRLTLSYAVQRTRFGQTEYAKPSQFIEEIPDEAAEKPASGFMSLQPRTAPARSSEFASSRTKRKPASAGRRRSGASRSGSAPYGAGDVVEHNKFGKGRVVEVTGYGDQARLTIDFPSVGSKTLVLQYANLKKL